MQKISPCLWFDKNCEEAMNYYVDTFNGSPGSKEESRIISIKRYEEGMEAPGMKDLIGKVITGIFELNGQRFMALDGGPLFKFSESVSFEIECDTQAELDYYWGKLSAVPDSEQCGWCKDKFGLSWQIVPKQIGEMMSDSNPEKVKAVINALLRMKKLNLAILKIAYEAAR